MIIKTTINIRKDLLELLEAASLATGCSRHSIVCMLMIRISQDHDLHSGPWKRIRYQTRGYRGNYRRIHVSLEEPVYELSLDLKKFCKLSVSHLFACAIDVYLNELVNNLTNNSDNYPLIKYTMNKTIVNGTIYWLLKWHFSAGHSQMVSRVT
jgi:hypothetical protein